MDNLNHMAAVIPNWNHHIFGNIHYKKKKKLLARINGIQCASCYGNNPYLEELEKSLEKELSEVLNQEEMLWFQKSSASWIKDGRPQH